MLSVLSLDARRSSVAEREPFVRALAGQVRSAAIPLVTCNRVELVGSSETASLIESPLATLLPPVLGPRFLARAEQYHGEAAAVHLLRVAAGLESQVEGDVQVLGQVRSAYAAALKTGPVAAELHRLFQTALRAGKRVHAETAFGKREASVGSGAAMEIVSRLKRRDPEGHCGFAWIIVLGAGRAAERAARTLIASGCTVTILNRNRDRAEALAQAVGADAGPFEERHRIIAAADGALLVTSASAPILVAEVLQAARNAAGRRDAPLAVVDLAVPRNAEPSIALLPGVSLIGLQQIPGNTLEDPEARAAAERIISEELGELRAWIDSRAEILR
jgi:glutamyl-tRNA reductase